MHGEDIVQAVIPYSKKIPWPETVVRVRVSLLGLIWKLLVIKPTITPKFRIGLDEYNNAIHDS